MKLAKTRAERLWRLVRLSIEKRHRMVAEAMGLASAWQAKAEAARCEHCASLVLKPLPGGELTANDN